MGSGSARARPVGPPAPAPQPACARTRQIAMARALDPKLREQLAIRLQYYREMGIYDFYRREGGAASAAAEEPREEMGRKRESKTVAVMPSDERHASESTGVAVLEEVAGPRDVAVELRAISEDIGECTRCRLSKGRKNIVFGTGNVHAELMFVGEGPGADEDEQGLPFVGRAGQLLTQMIENTASKEGIPIRRPDVYICNVVKCRPPENRAPQPDEMEICGQFLFRQLMVIRPKAICAMGS